MTIVRSLACILAAIAAAPLPAFAAATPSPTPSPHRFVIPPPTFPKEKLHAEYVVEVNKKGQVVRIKSGKGTKYGSFNAQTYGNALQMWIRRPDGTAIVGLYRVSYDYTPSNHHVARHVALMSRGGSWANSEGAANVMMDTAKKEAAEARKHPQSNGKLPALNQITGKKTPTPSPVPFFSPKP
jgi:hypothetical protein